MSKEFWKSSTMQVAALVAVMGVVETNFAMLQDLLGQWYGLSYIGLSVAMVLLRMKTTTAVRL